MTAALTDKNQSKHQFLYWEFHGRSANQTLQAVRMGDWKGIRFKAGTKNAAPIQLFNLAQDLGETKNVAVKHPEVVKRIAQIMEMEHAPSKIFPFQREE